MRSKLPSLRSWAFRAALAVLALSVAPGLAQGQEWRGNGRVSGTVKGEKGQPIEGARVTLRLGEGAPVGPPTATTDRRGRWALLGLAGGRWSLTVEAEGYTTAHGWATVTEAAPSPLVPVELRPLSEVSPLGIESAGQTRTTVIAWLEKADALLAQGRYTAAREEYGRALTAVGEEARPAILRSIARTHFLEGDKETSLLVLQRAQLAAPEDASTRQVLLSVGESLGRSAEVEAWLARLARGEREALAAELPPEEGGDEANDLPELPTPEPAQAQRTGALQVRFAERAPEGDIAEVAKRWGLEVAQVQQVDPAGGRYDLATESFSVFVPESYRPGEGWGLFVWISPGPIGGVRRAELLAVMAEQKLIWVGANNAGNDRPKWTRVGLALDALHNMQRLYTLDERRRFVGGYSGGGRTASALAYLFPDRVTGVFNYMGVDWFRKLPIPDRPGTHWPAAFPEPARADLRRLKDGHRFALVTGELDFNRVQTKATQRAMEEAGFHHVRYLEIPQASHYTPMSAEGLAQGLAFLGGRE
jgi:tetratricopeptide (TPR) repeat protein